MEGRRYQSGPRKRRARGFSIQDKLALVMVLLVTVTVLALVLESGRRMGRLADTALERGKVALMALLVDQLAPTLDFSLPDDAANVLESALRNPDIGYVGVCDGEGEVFVERARGQIPEGLFPCQAVDGMRVAGMELAVREIVNPAGEQVGRVVTGLKETFRTGLLNEHWQYSLLFGVIVLAIAVLVASLLGRLLTRPVLELTEAAEHISSSTDLGRTVERTSQDEIGDLTRSFNAMLTRLQEALVSKVVAEDASRAKSEFLANMSHEIRTPMNAVMGLTQLCLQEDLTWKHRDYLNKIHAAGRSLLRIIDDILDLSKIEAGKMELESVDFLLEEVLEGLADLMALRAQEKGLELLFHVLPDVPRVLHGDPLRLGQILLNLTSNAVKYTDSGEVVVTIGPAQREGGRLRLHASVRDTGIGIPADKIPQLFDSFRQADGSTTRRYGGTGLGLTICRQLVEMMEGNIAVESVPGEGSTFTVSLLLAEGTESRLTVAAAPDADLSGNRVLVVDDNFTARELLRVQLEGFGLRVDTVSSGEEALERVAEAPEEDSYRLVLMDWKMPGLDGLATSRRLKEQEGSGPVPLVIMVTAHARQDVLVEAERMGLDGFVVKPVDGPGEGGPHARRDGAKSDAGGRGSCARARYAGLAGGRQPAEPAGGVRPAGAGRGPRGRGGERCSGRGDGAGPDVRRRAHGHPDAGDGRFRGDAADPGSGGGVRGGGAVR